MRPQSITAREFANAQSRHFDIGSAPRRKDFCTGQLELQIVAANAGSKL